jgi:hypothetical protein
VLFQTCLILDQVCAGLHLHRCEAVDSSLASASFFVRAEFRARFFGTVACSRARGEAVDSSLADPVVRGIVFVCFLLFQSRNTKFLGSSERLLLLRASLHQAY